MEPEGAPAPIRHIAALEQPIRRDLYRLLADRGAWVTRDEASRVLALPRSVAAFHLDKLAEAGVVEVTYERLSGRRGPGAGRPAKLYRPHLEELAATVPERHYDLAGSVLAEAVEEATGTGTPVQDCLSRVARRTGRRIGDGGPVDEADPEARRSPLGPVLGVLADHGYEPEERSRGEVALRNCPFHRLAEAHRDLVCGMNVELLAGVLEAMASGTGVEARLAPEPGYCCVRLQGRSPTVGDGGSGDRVVPSA